VNQVAGVELVVGAPPIVVRLRPATRSGPFKVEFSAVDIRAGGRAAVRRQGTWSLELERPDDIASALRTEQLSGSGQDTTGGITVRAVSAVRSTTETLVTVELQGPPGIATLALPRLEGSSPAVYGARVGGSSDSGLATFAFPNTPMGGPLRVRFDEFIVTSTADGAQWIDIALGSLLTRQGIEGKPRDTAVVDPSDVIGRSDGLASDVREVWFAGTTDGSLRLVSFVVSGLYQDVQQFSLILSDGREVMATGGGSETGTTATGDIGGGEQSYVQFRFNSIDDLDRNVRLAFGSRSEVVRGPWAVNFEP